MKVALYIMFLINIIYSLTCFVDCPDDWVEFDTAQRCYKFVYSPVLSFEQATVKCSVSCYSSGHYGNNKCTSLL